MKVGNQMASTIKDIAKRTGLGLATISSYLNGGNVREKNKRLIEEAIVALHLEVNEVARGLKTNTTKTIGVVIPELSNLFCTEIISEIEDILRNHGYATIVCDCRTNPAIEREVIEFLYKKRVDGIINIPVNTNGEHLQVFAENQKPILLIDRKIRGLNCESILVDNLEAIKESVEYLIEKGHREIGVIAGPQDIYTAQERLLGYKVAMLESGFELKESLIACGDYTMESGVHCMQELLLKNKTMTAVVVTNYEMTMGAMISINEQGIKVPEDISIIGFDNKAFARANAPELTIVTQPTQEIAQYAARMMLDRLNGGDSKITIEKNKIIKLQTELIEGQSVKTLDSRI